MIVRGRWERRGGWVGLVSRSLCFGRVIAFGRSGCSAGCEGKAGGRKGGEGRGEGIHCFRDLTKAQNGKERDAGRTGPVGIHFASGRTRQRGRRAAEAGVRDERQAYRTCD